MPDGETIELRQVQEFAEFPDDVKKVVQNNGGGHVNHTMFWQIMKPGGGGRFAKGVSDLEKEGKSEESAKSIMAAAGRKKWGAKKMAGFAKAGRERA